MTTNGTQVYLVADKKKQNYDYRKKLLKSKKDYC
jgi:hypothetical protein